MLPRLILIADQIAAAGRPLADVVVSAAAGVDGQIIVQLRDPDLSDAAAVQLLRTIRRRAPGGTVLSVNNRPAVARALGIGLHLPGYADLPGERFRPQGRSVHQQAEADTAVREAADYAIVGTIFATASHPGRQGVGLQHLCRLSAALSPIPAYAIGGISAANARGCIEAGAWGTAVRGAIMSASDPAAAARRIGDALAP